MHVTKSIDNIYSVVYTIYAKSEYSLTYLCYTAAMGDILEQHGKQKSCTDRIPLILLIYI